MKRSRTCETHVLAPLAHTGDQVLEGNGRLETKLPSEARRLLADTVPTGHTAPDYARALRALIGAYRQLFPAPAPGVCLVDRAYFEDRIRHDPPA